MFLSREYLRHSRISAPNLDLFKVSQEIQQAGGKFSRLQLLYGFHL
jgi:hypothetical protein